MECKIEHHRLQHFRLTFRFFKFNSGALFLCLSTGICMQRLARSINGSSTFMSFLAELKKMGKFCPLAKFSAASLETSHSSSQSILFATITTGVFPSVYSDTSLAQLGKC